MLRNAWVCHARAAGHLSFRLAQGKDVRQAGMTDLGMYG